VLHPGGGDPAAAATIRSSPQYTAVHGLGLAGLLSMQLGLIGLYSWLAGGAPRLALTGFLMAFGGASCLVGVLYADAFTFPVVAARDPGLLGLPGPLFGSLTFLLSVAVPAIVWSLGLIVLAVAGLRARRVPRIPAAATIVGAVVVELHGAALSKQAGGIVLAVALAWTAALIWRSGAPAAAGSRVRPAAAPGREAGSPTGGHA
jgi:hypothetical protein